MSNEEKTVPEPQAGEQAEKISEEQPKLPSEIRLDPTEGSALHLSLASLQLSQKDVENMNLKIEKAQAEVRRLEGERGRLANVMRTKQVEFKKVMEKHGIPEGWSFFRQDDGTYLVRPPVDGRTPPRQPGVPQMPAPPTPPKMPTLPTPPVPPQMPAPPAPPGAPAPPTPTA